MTIDEMIKRIKERLEELKEYRKIGTVEDKGDMKHNLAEMYAKNMVDYGVDVTKAWQTAIQQSYALEKAYIRGRQYEVDRFNELRKEYNGGWIPCSERFPDNESYILLSFDNFSVPCVGRYKQDESGGAFYIGDDDETCISQELYVNAWQPLPEPFTEKKQ